MFKPSAPDRLLQAYLQNKRDLAEFDAKRNKQDPSVLGKDRPVLDVASVARSLGFLVRHITVSGVDKTQVSYDGKRWTDFEDFVLNHEAQIRMRVEYYTRLVGSDGSSKSYEEVHGTSEVHAQNGIAKLLQENFDSDQWFRSVRKCTNAAILVDNLKDDPEGLEAFRRELEDNQGFANWKSYLATEKDARIVEKLARLLKEAKGESN